MNKSSRSFKAAGLTIDYTLVRSSRRKKTMAIQVTPGGVIVRTPMRTPAAGIDAFIDSRRGWIAGKLSELESRTRYACSYADGERHYYLGRGYRLRIIGSPGRVRLKNGRFETYAPGDADEKDRREWVRRSLKGWYVSRAEAVIPALALESARRTGMNPKNISVKDLKRSWGICRSDSSLSFNWRLVAAPRRLIEFIVIHELCHLRHLNHSKDFYDLLLATQPDYQTRAAEFKAWALARADRSTF